MLILFDFKCLNGHVEEHLVDSLITGHVCSICNENGQRMISPVRSKLDGLDPGFPDAYDKWTRDHEKRGGDSVETRDELHSK